MSNPFKVALPSGALILVLLSTSIAFAKTFDDVAEDAWYSDFVEQLVEEGIVDPGDAYRPDDALTRAELAEMVIKAVDGLDGFEVPATPTFSDVPADSPYYNYVEAAFALDIVGGYTDANGDRTGMFGPEDSITRAATAKVLTSAFDIPVDAGYESIFPDVVKGAWFYDYVVSAYNQSIIDGYDNGYFGPGDSVTRAQIAKLIVNSQNPVERAGAMRNAATEAVSAEGGGLVISLSPYQPPALTVPRASAAPLLVLDFTAGDSNVVISQIILTRGGVGMSSDWASIYLYQGDFKITSEYSVDSSSNKVTIPVDLFIEAGTTVTIAAYGDTAVASVPLDQHNFYLGSASDITSDAQSVAGDFPISGNSVTIGSQYANTLLITPGATPLSPERDRHSEIASFKLTAGASSDVAVKALALTQGGSFSTSQMTDCSLLRSSDVVATAAGFYGEKLIFVPETPFIIPKGQSRNFYVKCYIDGGRTTDTIQLYLDQIYDLVTTDTDFGFAAAPLNYYSQTLTPSLNLKSIQIIIQ